MTMKRKHLYFHFTDAAQLDFLQNKIDLLNTVNIDLVTEEGSFALGTDARKVPLSALLQQNSQQLEKGYSVLSTLAVNFSNKPI